MKIILIESGSDKYSKDTWDEETEIYGNTAADLGASTTELNEIRAHFEGLIPTHDSRSWQWQEGSDATLKLVTAVEMTGKLELDIPVTTVSGGWSDIASTEISGSLLTSLNTIKGLL